MSGNTQARTMMDVWLEAQKQMWDSWTQTAQIASSSALFSPGLIDQWRKMATQGLEAWTTMAVPSSQNVSRQIIAAQAATIRFLEISTEAWTAMLPKLETGGDWESILRSYTEQFSQQLVQMPKGMFDSSQDMSELWKLYIEEVKDVVQPWAETFQHSPLHIGEAMSGSGSELIELTKLYWDAYERTFGRLVESPRMGFTRELDEKMLRGFDAWTDFRRASLDYQLILSAAWSRVFERVMRELITLTAQGKPLQSLRDLMRLWTEVADRELEEAFKSDAYIQAQERLFNATMRYRIREQSIVETYLKMSYIPTRSEVDEIHRSIYELRKEVKALKKALHNGRERRAEAPASPDAHPPTEQELMLGATPAAEQAAAPDAKPSRRKRTTASKSPTTQ